MKFVQWTTCYTKWDHKENDAMAAQFQEVIGGDNGQKSNMKSNTNRKTEQAQISLEALSSNAKKS